MRLATGTLVSADVPTTASRSSTSRATRSSVHLPPAPPARPGRRRRGPVRDGGSGARGGSRWMSRPQATPRPARPGGSDSRRAELIEAARRVIQRRGFAKATVGAITREAGASLGLLNYHFGSRTTSSPRPSRRPRAPTSTRCEAISRRHDDPRRPARRLPRPRGLGRPRRAGACGSTPGARRSTPSSCALTLEQFERGWRAVARRRAGRRRPPAAAGAAPDPEDAAGAAGRRARRDRAAHDAARRGRLDPGRRRAGRAGSSSSSSG